MAGQSRPEDNSILDARITIPDHVVYRVFPDETVALNLDTGRYHGLNQSAGAMLAILDELGSMPEAARRLSERLDVPRDTIEADLTELCLMLAERGLVQISSS